MAEAVFVGLILVVTVVGIVAAVLLAEDLR